MRFLVIIIVLLALVLGLGQSSLFAVNKKMTMTTYYPSPKGEYQSLNVQNATTATRLVVPSKIVANDSAGRASVVPGEIWVNATA